MLLLLHSHNMMRCVCHKYHAPVSNLDLWHQQVAGPCRCAACNVVIKNHAVLTGLWLQTAGDCANTAPCCDAKTDDACDAACRSVQATRITAMHISLHKNDAYRRGASTAVRVSAAATALQRCTWSHVNSSRCDVIRLLRARTRKLVSASCARAPRRHHKHRQRDTTTSA
jgi:hypothetical protein